MNAGNYHFKLTWSSLWHILWLGATSFICDEWITILKLVLLLDVSKWQGAINFMTMHLAGGKGVIVKAGQGCGEDIRFRENWQKAKQAGIPRGTYFFYDSRVDPRTQALRWWEAIKGDQGELKHFLDLEESYGGTWKGWRNWKICLQEFMRLSGMPASKIGIYTGYFYWIANSPITLADLNWFAQFVLWLAWYTSNPANVLIPKPWTVLLMWQFGTPAEGQRYGAESLEIDQSWFNGDDRSYRQTFGLDDCTQPPIVLPPAERPAITPEPRLWSGEVLPLRKMIVRTYPLCADDTVLKDGANQTMYAYGGELFQGKIWAGNDYLWMRIEICPRSALIGNWVAVRRSDGLAKYITLRSVVSVPEPNPSLPPLWRVKHDKELGKLWRPNLPEVHPLFPNHHVPFNEAWQRLSKAMNPLISANKWTTVYAWRLWITNNQGFGNPEDPRKNVILGKNLDCELPRVEALVTGGTILTGYVSGSNLVVETLDWRTSPPLPEWIAAHPWFRVPAVSVDSLGTPRRFPQGEQPNGEIVTIFHPLLADPARYPIITIPLVKLQRWTCAELPDPFRFYS